jgi:6-pyruvoyltetrahydropterin/6-carboxytetrahydropterin synthase
MIIRKLFAYEASHQVYDAYSRRCSHSVHGHSYKVEFKLQSMLADAAGMVMDFSLIKKYIGEFVDSFDHSHMLIWENKHPSNEVKAANKFFTSNNERWVSLPFNSTAEMQAKMFYVYGVEALGHMKRTGIGDNVFMHSVIVHETSTGYAEYNWDDYFPETSIENIIFSKGIQDEWSVEFKKFYMDMMYRLHQ